MHQRQVVSKAPGSTVLFVDVLFSLVVPQNPRIARTDVLPGPVLMDRIIWLLKNDDHSYRIFPARPFSSGPCAVSLEAQAEFSRSDRVERPSLRVWLAAFAQSGFGMAA